jgi:two-component system sensor histidine kinase CiaH
MQTARKKLAFVTVIYWFLLAYIMAALVWWFVSLEQQNKAMTDLRLSELNPSAANFEAKKAEVLEYQERKHAQYVGEGIIFMLLIWVGAVFVYLGAMRYLKLGQQQQNFMMAVTHELKTPIAIARLNIETLQRRHLDASQKDRILQQTLNETERLNDLCDNILLASRFDSGTIQSHYEEVSLNELVSESVDQFSTRFPDREIIFQQGTRNVMMMGDRTLLRMMMNNLIENALKYAPKSEPIKLSITTEKNQVQISVADLGKGIPIEERRKVFDKFYRMGNEKTRQTKGTGLGLYLVNRIAADHKGTIEIKDNIPQGSIFIISFQS